MRIDACMMQLELLYCISAHDSIEGVTDYLTVLTKDCSSHLLRTLVVLAAQNEAIESQRYVLIILG